MPPDASACSDQGQLTRACVDLAKAWRMDKFLRRLDVRRAALPSFCLATPESQSPPRAAALSGSHPLCRR